MGDQSNPGWGYFQKLLFSFDNNICTSLELIMITYLVFKIINFVQNHEIDDQTPISESDS